MEEDNDGADIDDATADGIVKMAMMISRMTILMMTLVPVIVILVNHMPMKTCHKMKFIVMG